MTTRNNATQGRTLGSHGASSIVLACCVALIASVFDASRAAADADDTLCHAISAAGGGPVDWPDDEYEPSGVFDNVLHSPWWFSQDARDYIAGYFAGGHHWGDKGDVLSFNPTNYRVDTPIGRTYNGYANIVYADIDVYDPPFGPKLDRTRSARDYDYYDTFLKWASAFVYRETFRVDGACNRDGGNVATTHNGWLARNDYIRLWQNFYYNIDAVKRASIIVHEVRHADGVSHSGSCPRGGSCDPRWTHGGANTYEMLWLAAYYHTPHDHPYITQARRDRAEVHFDYLRQMAFAVEPDWILGNFLFINLIPDYYLEFAVCSEDPYNTYRCLICC